MLRHFLNATARTSSRWLFTKPNLPFTGGHLFSSTDLTSSRWLFTKPNLPFTGGHLFSSTALTSSRLLLAKPNAPVYMSSRRAISDCQRNDRDNAQNMLAFTFSAILVFSFFCIITRPHSRDHTHVCEDPNKPAAAPPKEEPAPAAAVQAVDPKPCDKCRGKYCGGFCISKKKTSKVIHPPFEGETVRFSVSDPHVEHRRHKGHWATRVTLDSSIVIDLPNLDPHALNIDKVNEHLALHKMHLVVSEDSVRKMCEQRQKEDRYYGERTEKEVRAFALRHTVETGLQEYAFKQLSEGVNRHLEKKCSCSTPCPIKTNYCHCELCSV